MDASALNYVTSPLTLFGLVILVCNAIFAACATVLKEPEIFKYTLHMFIAIVFLIGGIVLWAPAYLYHPREVNGLDLPYNPWVPTTVMLIGFMVYAIYHAWKHHTEREERLHQKQTE